MVTAAHTAGRGGRLSEFLGRTHSPWSLTLGRVGFFSLFVFFCLFVCSKVLALATVMVDF